MKPMPGAGLTMREDFLQLGRVPDGEFSGLDGRTVKTVEANYKTFSLACNVTRLEAFPDSSDPRVRRLLQCIPLAKRLFESVA
jgi:hypothetical protein